MLRSSSLIFCRWGNRYGGYAPVISAFAYRKKPCIFGASLKRRAHTVQGELHLDQGNPNGVHAQKKPVALVVSWLFGSRKNMKKYLQLYWDRGIDTVSVYPGVKHILMPSRAQNLASSLMDYFHSSQIGQRPVFVHAFSVGGYQWGNCLLELHKRRKEGSTDLNLVGQIYDSPVEYDGVPNGLARASTNNRVAQVAIEQTALMYLRLFHSLVTHHYEKCSNAFHDKNLTVPSVWYYGSDDPIAAPHHIERVMNKWKARNLDVRPFCFEDSRHVTHLRYHPETYEKALDLLIEDTIL